jgi:hypothetical protein
MNMTAAKKPLPLNAAGCLTAIVPCDRPVRIGAMSIQFNVLEHVNRMQVNIDEIIDGTHRHDSALLYECELKSFRLGRYRFRYARPVLVAGGIALVVNIFPIH